MYVLGKASNVDNIRYRITTQNYIKIQTSFAREEMILLHFTDIFMAPSEESSSDLMRFQRFSFLAIKFNLMCKSRDALTLTHTRINRHTQTHQSDIDELRNRLFRVCAWIKFCYSCRWIRYMYVCVWVCVKFEYIYVCWRSCFYLLYYYISAFFALLCLRSVWESWDTVRVTEQLPHT